MKLRSLYELLSSFSFQCLEAGQQQASCLWGRTCLLCLFLSSLSFNIHSGIWSCGGAKAISRTGRTVQWYKPKVWAPWHHSAQRTPDHHPHLLTPQPALQLPQRILFGQWLHFHCWESSISSAAQLLPSLKKFKLHCVLVIYTKIHFSYKTWRFFFFFFFSMDQCIIKGWVFGKYRAKKEGGREVIYS